MESWFIPTSLSKDTAIFVRNQINNFYKLGNNMNTQKQNPWLDRSKYPFESKFIELDGQQLHYIDEGQGPVILFVHGTPSWSFDFRKIIIQLRKEYRCIAFDHIGFGLSDKPKDYDYSLDRHVQNLAAFVKKLQLEKLSLVLHDFGGPIGLEWAFKHVEQVERITLMNTWWGDSRDQPEFKKMLRILKSPLLPFLYKWLNFSARFLLPQAFGDRKKLSKEIHRHYKKPFSRPSERMGTIGFAKSLANDQDFFAQQWAKREELAHLPFLLIWGMQDRFIGEHYLKKIERGLPQTQGVRLAEAGHFPQEEEAEALSQAIEAFTAKAQSPQSTP